jgi:3-oxoadipate enol-lactonase
MWLPVLPFLSGFRCIYFDNRGTGNSDKAETPYSIADMANDANRAGNRQRLDLQHLDGRHDRAGIAAAPSSAGPKSCARSTMAGGSTAIRASEEVYQRMNEAFVTMPVNLEQALDLMMPVLFPVEFISKHPELKSMFVCRRSNVQ